MTVLIPLTLLTVVLYRVAAARRERRAREQAWAWAATAWEGTSSSRR
jgi:hypothetical protein